MSSRRACEHTLELAMSSELAHCPRAVSSCLIRRPHAEPTLAPFCCYRASIPLTELPCKQRQRGAEARTRIFLVSFLAERSTIVRVVYVSL